MAHWVLSRVAGVNNKHSVCGERWNNTIARISMTYVRVYVSSSIGKQKVDICNFIRVLVHGSLEL